MRFIRNEPLKKHTSIHIGGPADYFCLPKNMAELLDALNFARKNRLRIFFIGAGTNLLVLDRGFRGLVVKIAGGLKNFNINKGEVIAGSGILLPRFLKMLADKGLGGLEFLAGVPGTVGGAVVMNAGAWGKDIGKYVNRMKVIDLQGKERQIAAKSLKFGYRQSILQNKKWVVVEVVFKLRRRKRQQIYKKMREYISNRKEKQPLGIPNCGCIFKNPKGGFAGKLIDEAGCRSLRVGDAQVSDKHANFIVNLGEAKARDVIKLIYLIQKATRVKLEPEIKII